MSRSRPSPVEWQEITFTCHYCGAEPGRWCRAKSGVYSTFLHGSRWEQAWDLINKELEQERTS